MIMIIAYQYLKQSVALMMFFAKWHFYIGDEGRDATSDSSHIDVTRNMTTRVVRSLCINIKENPLSTKTDCEDPNAPILDWLSQNSSSLTG